MDREIGNAPRRIVYRLLGYSEALKDFFDTFERIRQLQLE